MMTAGCFSVEAGKAAPHSSFMAARSRKWQCMAGNKEAFSTAMNAADRFRWESQWAEAAGEYQRALDEFPEDAMARSGLGFCYMQTRQWQQALNEYECMLRRDPGNIIALSKTAEVFGILDRRDEAYQAYLHLARLYTQAGQGTRAEAALQKAAQLSPDRPEPHVHLADHYAAKRDLAATLQERMAAAQAYYQDHNFSSAREQCEEALRLDRTNMQAQQMLLQMDEHRRPFGSQAGVQLTNATTTGMAAGEPQEPLSLSGGPINERAAVGDNSEGNTSIMGEAGNFAGAGNPNLGQMYAAPDVAGRGNEPSPRRQVTASQVTGVLRQAQTFQSQGRFDDAIDLCEQIIDSGFDRPDVRYFLGYLYQERKRWDEAITQFKLLLNDPDYSLSCYYALGQCYLARGDLHAATIHFDEAVDRVNLDALTLDEADQLVQLCQEAADAHRALGEQEQALTVYSALLGFLRSRGWNDKVAQVEYLLQQLQTRPVAPAQQANGAMAMPHTQSGPLSPPPASTQLPVPPQPSQQAAANTSGELPDWLTGILDEPDKTQVIKPGGATHTPAPLSEQPTTAQQMMPVASAEAITAAETTMLNTLPQAAPLAQAPSSSWLTAGAQPGQAPERDREAAPAQLAASPTLASPTGGPVPAAPTTPPASPAIPVTPRLSSIEEQFGTIPVSGSRKPTRNLAEDLLSQLAGASTKDEALKRVADAVQASTASLPDSIRLSVAQAMQDIQKYINHGLLNPATEECLRVIDMAPQYLDVHQVLCEILVRQDKVEEAITKYAILVDAYLGDERFDDAIATYRRILQLEPDNLTYRMRLIDLLAAQGRKEDLLRERSLAAEAYLHLGYMDRALAELERALKEGPTSVPTRLNYALALQKLGRTQQAMAEYQRVLQVDPGNLTALVRWHIALVTGGGAERASGLEVLSRIRWRLRGEGQRHYEAVAREYNAAAEAHAGNTDIQFALGQIHQQAASYDWALQAYQMAMRGGEIEALARVSAAHCLLAQGRPEQAIQHLEKSLRLVRQTPAGFIDPRVWAVRPREDGEEHQAPEVELSMLLAKAYGRTGQQEKMQTILRQLKQTTTRKDEVSSALAEISARQGNVESALQEYIELAHHYRHKKQVDNALNALQEMVRLAPQDPRAHDELADIYVQRGLLDEGIAELRLLADLYQRHNLPEQVGLTFQRVGNIYTEMGAPEEALVYLRRAAEFTPNSFDLLRDIVQACLQLGRSQEAAQYQVIIARHYFATQQVKEAVAALQQLITIDHQNYEAYDLLGQTYQSVGEYEQASRVYRNLAKVNPNNPLARERLAALQEMRAK